MKKTMDSDIASQVMFCVNSYGHLTIRPAANRRIIKLHNKIVFCKIGKFTCRGLKGNYQNLHM